MDEGVGRSALYIGCVYMPTYSTSVAVVECCLKKMYFVLEKRVR